VASLGLPDPLLNLGIACTVAALMTGFLLASDLPTLLGGASLVLHVGTVNPTVQAVKP
jgi:hypothetical protein